MGQKEKILLVDDEPAVLKVTKLRLEHEGYEVLSATDGKQALEYAAAGGVDLILLDLKLPEMDGFEICKRLKQDPSTAKVPIIAFTASSVSWKKLTDRCIELGITDLIRKPFGSQELLQKVLQVFREKEVNDE